MSVFEANSRLETVLSANRRLTRTDLVYLLGLQDAQDVRRLLESAYRMKIDHVGKKVYFRGIIELSNICRKDCYYCGIRKSNSNISRYQLTEEEILQSARFAHESNYGSIVLQSGEREDGKFIRFIEKVIGDIKHMSSGRLGITLSLGEQSAETYTRWFDAGAHRYLLRIETSNENLYRRLHPNDHDFAGRVRCIESLSEIGYQVGTGVMIGLPGQTTEDLADDILFFEKKDVAMIGMGPYLVHKDTPLSSGMPDFNSVKDARLKLALKMIAVTRIYLKDVNIASTTALQALDPFGREMGLKAGANIIMPNVTGTQYRSSYQLYENKPCLDENSEQCRYCLARRLEKIGETVNWNQLGDSPHYTARH